MESTTTPVYGTDFAEDDGKHFTYFKRPVQVKWYDSENHVRLGGIGYQDHVICGCCGSLVSLEEIYKRAPVHIPEPIQVYSNWIDVSDAITG